MGLLNRLFSSKKNISTLRKAISQQRYADALLLVEELRNTNQGADEVREIDALATLAGDHLAKINLDEGLYLLKDQQLERAAEYLHLAQTQAVSAQLHEQIEQGMEQLATAHTQPNAAAGSCADCNAGHTVANAQTPMVDADAEPDFDSQVELILAGYPDALIERYKAKNADFLHALVLAHQGKEVEALKAFGKLPANAQDDLFDFEAGSLMARLGQPEKGCDALYSALQKNPDLILAAEALTTILVAQEKYEVAINFLNDLLQRNKDAAFCHAQLALIYHTMDNADEALRHGRQALDAGQTDVSIVLMTAMLLEAKNDLEGAEVLYRRIPAGGCAGGINLYLAEFLLRQKRELRKILDTFNHACGQEPENPRWQLRVAQTYLELGWDKRGRDLLNKVVHDPRLMEELRLEGQALLDN